MPVKDNETIADIIAEKRRRADVIERVVAEKMKRGGMISDQYARVLIADIRKEADRLEAAHKREAGDAAKLREALDELVANIEMRSSTFGLNVIVDTKTYLDAKAALAAPPRNCDRYTTFNDAIRALADKLGWHDGKWNSERYCILAQWLFAPATEKEGVAK